MQQPIFSELESELSSYKLYLINKYLEMLNPASNSPKDELELLEEFLNFFTTHQDRHNHYVEYMICLRSYILLSHAAIEEFIEKTAKYYLEQSITLHNQSKKINSTLKWFILKSDIKDKKFKDKNFDEILKTIKDEYFEEINENHGIKKHNLEKIYSRIGIETITYEVFESLGKMRGNFAHNNGKSAHLALKITTPLNPQECVKLVEDVLTMIKSEIIEVLSKDIV